MITLNGWVFIIIFVTSVLFLSKNIVNGLKQLNIWQKS